MQAISKKKNNTLCPPPNNAEQRRLYEAGKILRAYSRKSIPAKKVKKLLGCVGYKVNLRKLAGNTIYLTDTYTNRSVIVEI